MCKLVCVCNWCMGINYVCVCEYETFCTHTHLHTCTIFTHTKLYAHNVYAHYAHNVYAHSLHTNTNVYTHNIYTHNIYAHTNFLHYTHSNFMLTHNFYTHKQSLYTHNLYAHMQTLHTHRNFTHITHTIQICFAANWQRELLLS